MSPEEDDKLRAFALQLLNQRSEGSKVPPEIVVTYRKHDDYEKFVRQIAELQKELEQAKYTASQMSLYAEENFRLYDQLRQAYLDMEAAGLDVSYITSVRVHRRLK